MKKRSCGAVYKMSEQQYNWLHSRCCPICGLHKDKWTRRKDWRCCSTKCTSKFSDLTFIWQIFRLEIFIRDKHTCVKCGEKPMITSCYDPKSIPNDAALIGDHIIPIALGGEEFELDNVQTLCIPCDKIKTAKDMKDIAKQRRKEKMKYQKSL